MCVISAEMREVDVRQMQCVCVEGELEVSLRCLSVCCQ